MSELAYSINHIITVAWLVLAGVYVYYAVIADIVTAARARKHEETTPAHPDPVEGPPPAHPEPVEGPNP